MSSFLGCIGHFDDWKRRTYQRCKDVRFQGVEVISVQRVLDFTNSSVGAIDGNHPIAEAGRNYTLCRVRWVHRPVPIRKSYAICKLHGPVMGLAYGILIRNIHSAVMEYLFEQSKVWPVPGAKNATCVGTVAHHLVAWRSSCVVPLLEGHAMYPCQMSVKKNRL
jgi:hypothetical protein